MSNRSALRAGMVLVALGVLTVALWWLQDRAPGSGATTAARTEPRPPSAETLPSQADQSEASETSDRSDASDKSDKVSATPRPPATVAQPAAPLTAAAEGLVAPVPTGVQDRYTRNEVLDERVGEVGPDGQYERVRIVKTGMKYPLVRVEEKWQGASGKGQVAEVGGQRSEVRGQEASGVVSPESGVPPLATCHLPLATLLSQTAMVADHVTLKVKEGTSESQLAAYAQGFGGTILRKLRVPGPGTYLVAFDKATVDTVPTAVAALGQAGSPVEYVNPDYVVYAAQTIPNDPLFNQLWGMNNTSQIAGTGTVVSATNAVSGTAIAFSPVTNGVTGNLYYCGMGDTGEFPAAVSNNIALIKRGTLTFAQKATNAKAAGAKAVIIYNNVYGSFSGTFSASGDWLPSLGISDTDGAKLMTQTNTSVTVAIYGCKLDADIDAPEAWDISTGSTNIIVGVIDTGVDYNHPDLASNMWVNLAELNGTNGVDDDLNGFIDDVHGYDFCNNDGNPMDDHLHGTHCSGTIGGVGNNGVGVAGVCWKVRIMGLKFLSWEGSGNQSDAMEAVYYASSNGVKLTSNSWGGGGFDPGLHDAIVDAGNRGILFVAAAGNSMGNNDASPTYPGSYDCSNIIAVAATDNNDELASFSCYGATSVDIAAPGVSILSCFPTYMTQAMTDGGYSTNYASISGTSMATPAVAGACALLKVVHPELTMAQWRAQLLIQAEPIPALSGKCLTGARLNVFQALTIPAKPVLRLWGQSVSDPAPGGNADGRINPGETGRVTVVLINGSSNTALGVTTVLTTTNPVMTIISNTVAFGDIAGFSEGQSSNAFVFVVATDCPPQLVSCELASSDTEGGAWTNTILVRVRGATRIAGTVTFNSAPANGFFVGCYGTDVDTGEGIGMTAYADDKGQYTFDLLDGTYNVYAQHPSIQNLYAAALGVTVPPAATNVDFAMGSATISGRVTDARTGNPLVGATVDYYVVGDVAETLRWNAWVQRGSTTVDTNGYYSLMAAVSAVSIVSVSPWAPGYSNPTPREVILPPDTQNVDFAMSAPDVNIGVSPAVLNVAGVTGQIVTQTLVIANSGGASLPWTLWNESDEGNATAGQKIRTIKIASDCFYPRGAAYDGSALCLVQDWSPYMGLYRVAPTNGALLNNWSEDEIRFILNDPIGLDWDGMNFWFMNLSVFDKKVSAVDPATHKPVKSLRVCQNDSSYPTAVVFGDGYLWVLTRNYRILKTDPRTGATLATLSPAVGEAYGLEYFSGALWVLDWGSGGKIYKISPTDGHVIRSFNSPNRYSWDLAKDRAGNLWVQNDEFDNAYAYLVRIGTAPWLTQGSSSGTAAAGGSNTVQMTFNTTTAGLGIHTAMVSVASSDPDEPEKLVPVIFTVTATLPPVIDTPASATPNPVTLPATAALSVTAHDPNSDPLSYTWSKVSGPGTVSFTPNGTAASANSTAGFGAAGTYVLRVTVVSTNRSFEQATSDVTVYAVGIENDVSALSVPEGSNSTFRVRLVTQPVGSVTVAVARVSGDADITVTNGASLVFDTGNWSAWQTVTLAAAPDEDIENGVATIALSAAGLLTANVTATEQEAGTILQINAGPGGTVSPAGRNVVLIGVPVTVTATADATHAFARWVCSAGAAVFANPLAATTTVTVTGPTTIRANFNPPPSLSAWACGWNAEGQIGDGTKNNRSSMVQVISSSKPLTNILAIAGGDQHTAALRNDGRVLAWGGNWVGQLGDGTTNGRVNPVLVTTLSNVTAISAGLRHTMALTSDSNVWAWGQGNYGQLGNGTNSASDTTPTPTPVKVLISNVTAIAGGSLFSLALKSDGSVWGWGWNAFGQLGNGTTTNTNRPVQVSGLSNVTAIAAGGADFGVALKADGTVWQWGYGVSMDVAYTPFQVAISNVIAVTAGNGHTVALKADGTVWAWAMYNAGGVIGDGTIGDFSVFRFTPTQSLISNVIAIASYGGTTLALKGDGSVWTWGANYYGQCGDGTSGNNKPTPLQVPGTRDFVGIAGAGYHSLALRQDQPYIRITNNVASLTVPEGGTNTFQVRLSAQPWTNVTVTVIRESGDGDISVTGGTNLTFTTNNWSTWQPVTVTAAEDADASNGTAVIWLSGADFDARVTATEVDNDATLTVYAGANGAVSPNGATVVNKGATNSLVATPDGGYWFSSWSVISGAPTLGNANAATTTVVITSNATVQASFVVPRITSSVTSLSVPEGGTNTFLVTLSGQPFSDTTVSVNWGSGDTDITVQAGGNLTFTPANWYVGQTVTLAAAEDNSDASNGTAAIWLTGAGLGVTTVTVTEAENDTTLTVNAGANGTVSPSGAVVVTKGSTNTITATPNQHYFFTNWTVIAGSPTISNVYAATTTVVIVSNATVQANFLAIPAMTCAITSPANGTFVKAGTNLTISATAWSYTGTVSKVEFYRDGVKIGEDLDSPYSCVWSNVPVGGYSLSAKATDNNNATGVSAAVYVVVTASGGWESPWATGGTVTNYTLSGTNYRAHIFTNIGTQDLTFHATGAVEYLVVAGGGGGGGREGGGGGAGGVLTGMTNVASTAYTVVVGGGGQGGVNGGANGTTGANSSFAEITASGGGFGGSGTTASTAANRQGGSGGGGGRNTGNVAAGLATAGQGNAGGLGKSSYACGGGGGAGAAGQDGTNSPSQKSGDGGAGLASSLSGVSVMYAGGGGAGGGKISGSTLAGTGGAGGGGDGTSNDVAGASGVANTGGGGGGGGYVSTGGGGGVGGSGIVIVRYVVGVMPSAPSGLTATASATNRIELSWTDNATNETGYVVDRSTDSNSWSGVTQTDSNTTSCSDSGLATNTLYYYRVAASNSLGLSAYAYASARTWTAYEQWRHGHFTAVELTNSAVSGDDADPDNDHFPNIKEFWAGTIPTNGASYLGINEFVANPGAAGEYVVSWQSVTGRVYTLQATTNLLVVFTNCVTNIPATPPLNVHTDNVGTAGMKFYRVKLE